MTDTQLEEINSERKRRSLTPLTRQMIDALDGSMVDDPDFHLGLSGVEVPTLSGALGFAFQQTVGELLPHLREDSDAA